MMPRFSVSQCIAILNQTLETAFGTIEVEGEVANFKVNQNKYVFFDIKDDEGLLGCFMTVYQLRIPLEDGMKVRVVATPKVTAWGRFSLTVQRVVPIGEGSIKKSFELLKQRLEKEGLFAPERKRTLPSLPMRIGVISSTQAAGYADFIKILGERFGGLEIDVVHVSVQGAEAADQIIKALAFLNEQASPVDVVVIVRGGGSKEDLAVFNDEPLVRAVAVSRIPTLTGIGHEVDESLVDLVADVAASTPSNAAQVLVPDRRELAQTVQFTLHTIASHVQQRINNQQQVVHQLVDTAYDRLVAVIERKRHEAKELKAFIGQCDPEIVLQRGYALLKGDIIRGGKITIETYKQVIRAEVEDVKAK